MTRSSPTFRRFALALILARGVAFAAAPLLEGVSAVHAETAVSAAQPDAPPSVPAHDPASCPACLLMQAHSGDSSAPGTTGVAATTESAVAKAQVEPVRTLPRTGFTSRAPPGPAA